MNAFSRNSGLVIALMFAGISSGKSAEDGSSVVVVYNSNVPASKEVAEYYAKARQVPDEQVMGFELSEGEGMTRSEFRYNLQEPLFKKLKSEKIFTTKMDTSSTKLTYLVSESKIRYLVLCYGVPVRIKPETGLKEPGTSALSPQLRRNESAVDTELAWLPILETRPILAGPMANEFYLKTNSAAFNPTNGILMTARLDGPTPAVAKSLVDRALSAETNGLWGRMYFDLRNISKGEYKKGDDWIKNGSAVARQLGFETIVDNAPPTFGATFPMSHIAFYAGWYDVNASGPFSLDTVDFMPGAVAYHLHSFSAANIRSPSSHWVGPLLSKGAAATIGFVYEPYLEGTLDVGVFTSRFIFYGFSLGEAAYAASPVLSWQTSIIGDPLYRPFALNAQQLHERLVAGKSSLVEWSHLRVINLNQVMGTKEEELIGYLNQIPDTKKSAVLLEKLGGLYEAIGKPNSSMFTFRQALGLATTKPQRARLSLALVDKLLALKKSEEAFELLEGIVADFPEYRNRIEAYKQMLGLAEEMKKDAESAALKQKIADAEKAVAAEVRQ